MSDNFVLTDGGERMPISPFARSARDATNIEETQGSEERRPVAPFGQVRHLIVLRAGSRSLDKKNLPYIWSLPHQMGM